MKSFSRTSPAKVNLGLRITGKRADGYHLLETCFYPVPSLSDEIAIHEAGNWSLEEEGIVIGGEISANLMYRAWSVLKTQFPALPNIHVRIRKSIPAGAGLGGGSSNAATVALLMNEAFDLGLDNPALARILAPLGADVPFFLYQEPMLATGIGQDLQPVSVCMQGYEIKIFTQHYHSSTVAAYQALLPTDYQSGEPLPGILIDPPVLWQDRLHNDLEHPVFRLIPQLTSIKQQLYDLGAVYAAMSGSGSAFFGIFPI